MGVERFNKTVLKGKRYRPDVQLSERVFANADGLYWHSEKKKGRRYHRELRVAFEDEGLRLLQFYEDEIRDKPDIVKSIVDAILGKSPSRIYARKCEIKDISALEANDFLVKNHLMGPCKTARNMGLLNAGVLVHVFSYRVRKGYLEIVRSASTINTVIVGGFQKILKACQLKTHMRTVYTLVDLRYADGHSLEKAGFVPVKTYQQYQYTDGVNRKDKRVFRVKAGIDETQAAADKGWYRIWDAGRRAYLLSGIYTSVNP